MDLNLREFRELLMMRSRDVSTFNQRKKGLHLMSQFGSDDPKANETGKKRMAYLMKNRKQLEAERDMLLKFIKEKHYGVHYKYWKDSYLRDLDDPIIPQREDPIWQSLIKYDNRLRMNVPPTSEETNVDRLHRAKMEK